MAYKVLHHYLSDLMFYQPLSITCDTPAHYFFAIPQHNKLIQCFCTYLPFHGMLFPYLYISLVPSILLGLCSNIILENLFLIIKKAFFHMFYFLFLVHFFFHSTYHSCPLYNSLFLFTLYNSLFIVHLSPLKCLASWLQALYSLIFTLFTDVFFVSRGVLGPRKVLTAYLLSGWMDEWVSKCSMKNGLEAF